MLKHPTLPLFFNSRTPLARSNVFTSYLAVHPREQQFCIQLAYCEAQHLRRQSPLQTKSYQLAFSLLNMNSWKRITKICKVSDIRDQNKQNLQKHKSKDNQENKRKLKRKL